MDSKKEASKKSKRSAETPDPDNTPLENVPKSKKSQVKSTPKNKPSKTPIKKEDNSSAKQTSAAKAKKIKKELEFPSTSKTDLSKSVVRGNDDEEWDPDDIQENSNILHTDLPNYTTKFGIQEVKTDRFKLDVPHTNLHFTAVEEICLEGLDGITIEALWTRISVVLKQPLPLPSTITNFIWNIIRSRKDIEFYKLQDPRIQLVIFDRYQYSDPDLGSIMEPAEIPLDIYPYHPVKEKDNLLGSAASYETREDVTNEVRKLTLTAAELKYGMQLIMVAAQKLRAKSLMNPLADPNLEFTPAQYCLLERIGRSRRLGEITQGKISLQVISKDPKIVFYTRKILAENSLISKQPFYLKTHSTNHVTGSLLHLMRFYNEKKTKTQIMTEQIVEVLRNRPGYRMEYSETKQVFGNATALNKLFKQPDFQRFVKTDVQLKYRDLYPNAPVSDWKLKGSGKERRVRTIELINPNVNIGGSWNEEEPKEESSDDEETEEMMFNAPISHQIYNYIRLGGNEGRTLKQIQNNKGMDFYSVRAAVNQLVSQNLVLGVKIDIGRQRIIKYHTTDRTSDESEEVSASEREIMEASELESESLEFLSDLLEVDAEFLIPKSDPEVISTPFENPPNGNYALIKKLRQQNKLENKTKPENKETIEVVKCESILAHLLTDSRRLKSEHLGQLNTSDLTLEKIFKNQHEYNVANNILNVNNELKNNTTNLRTHLKEVFKEICCTEVSTDSNSLKNRKKKKIHKRMLSKLKQTKISENEPSPTVEEILKDIVCPLSLPTKDISSKQLYQKVLKLVKPLLMHFKYKIKTLMPKKRYMYRQKLTEEQLNEFSKDHPLLSLVTLDSASLKSKSHHVGVKRQAKSSENDSSKRIKLDDSTLTTVHDLSSRSFDIYMGPKPDVAYHAVEEEDVEVKVLVSTKPEEFDEPGSKYIKDNNATLRTLKRAHCILEAVRQEKVITDVRRLHKMIQTQDNNEGYNVKVDRKSIERIYTRLVRSGHIKIMQVILKSGELKRCVTVVCDPSLDIQHSLLQSVIEQLKVRFFIMSGKKEPEMPKPCGEKEATTFDTSEISYSVGELKSLSSNDSPYIYNRNIGKDYGHAPKFMRMRLLHEFFFYLIYNYPYGQEVHDVAGMFKELEVTVDDAVIKEMPKVYFKEIGWKMFIPPLPKHTGWPDGWALVCDVLLRLPLSLFVRVFNVSYVIPELPTYLDHPIKQYYLVRNLPSDIRSGLLHRRKYIFSIHESLARLCYIGILQFGPQKLREKDQLFIYLNRNATLFDTTTSNAGYHYVENKEYKQLQYYFSSLTDVEIYWNEMWNICVHSKLGVRNTVTGTYITIEQVETKLAMIEAMKAKTPEMALLNDNGLIPGDKRGAAGLDSALWSHMKRNWIWCSHKSQTESSQVQSPTTKKPVGKSEIKVQRKVPPKSNINKAPPEINSKDNLLPITESNRRTYKKLLLPKKPGSTPERQKQGKSYIRKVLPRIDMKKKRDYDSVDKKLMEKLKQSRSEWNEEEDRILQICKIVAVFLCPNFRRRAIPYTVMRDVLHKLSPCSTNKTSAACQRRLLGMFGTTDQQEYLYYIARSICHIPYVQKYFQKFYSIISAGNSLSEMQLHGAFVYLAAYFYKHQHEIQHIFEAISCKYQTEFKNLKTKPSSKDETSINNSNNPDLSSKSPIRTNQASYESTPVEVISYECTEITSSKNKTNKMYSHSGTFPQTETDILLDTIKSIIHSTVGSRQEEISWLYQLFRVYQNYTDEMLNVALSEIRNSQMVSVKRTYSKKFDEPEGLPIKTKFFQFSFYYCFAQITNFPPELFQEAHEVFLGITKHKEALTEGNGLPMECFAQGHAVGLAEIAVDINTYYDVFIPKEVLILNPKIADHTELIRELAVRYKKMLTLVKQGTYFKDDDNDENTAPNDDPNSTDEVDLPKQQKAVPRTPMIQRFLKSWFLADETDETEEDAETAVDVESPIVPNQHSSSTEESRTIATSKVTKKPEDSEKKIVKSEKRKKRTNQITSEQSKKILESLTPQIQIGKQDASSSSEIKDAPQNTRELNLYPVGGNASELSFEDYERKLESLLSTTINNYLPLEVTLEENRETENVAKETVDSKQSFTLTDYPDDINILEKYLQSKKHETVSTSVDVVDSIQTEKNDLFENQILTEIYRNVESADADPITNARIQYLMDDELTVEQIMEEMLVDCHEQDRKVPKPTNLARLLVTGLFPELDEDEERLERLHQHFLIVCPDTNLLLSNFEDNEEFRYLYLEHSQTCKKLLRKVQMDIIVNDNYSSTNGIFSKLKSLGGTEVDIFVTESLIDFVCKKRALGASVKQLKEHFSNFEKLKLSTVLQILTNLNVLIRTGITYIIYVHHKHKQHWLVESYTLEDQDRLKLKETKAEGPSDVDIPALAKSLDSYTEIKVKIMPWARIDGTLNLKVFEKWMCTVLGYCLSDSMLPLTSIINSCCYLKPAEVFYLIECLQELGCLQIYTYKVNKPTLFTEASYAEIVAAEVTDAFEDIYIEADRLAVIKFGTLLNKKSKEFDFPADEARKYGTF